MWQAGFPSVWIVQRRTEVIINAGPEIQWREEIAKSRDQNTKLASRIERLKASTPRKVRGNSTPVSRREACCGFCQTKGISHRNFPKEPRPSVCFDYYREGCRHGQEWCPGRWSNGYWQRTRAPSITVVVNGRAVQAVIVMGSCWPLVKLQYVERLKLCIQRSVPNLTAINGQSPRILGMTRILFTIVDEHTHTSARRLFARGCVVRLRCPWIYDLYLGQGWPLLCMGWR